MLHGKKFHVEQTSDGGARLHIEGHEHYSFTVTPDDLRQIQAFAEAWLGKMMAKKNTWAAGNDSEDLSHI